MDTEVRGRMRLMLATLIVALIGTVVAGASAAAGGRTLGASALLTSSQVVPRLIKSSSATGHFSATLTKTAKGYTMHWRLTYSQLGGSAAWTYIHRGAVGKYGPAVFILCQRCSSGRTGNLYVSPWAFNLMQAGKTYITIRTKAYPAGEVRGQIKIG